MSKVKLIVFVWLIFERTPSIAAEVGRYDILQVEIATWGLTNPIPSSIATLPYVGPVLESTVGEVRRKYVGRINFTITYVVDKNLWSCLDLVDEIDYLMAEWYYRRRVSADLSVFIGAGCSERVNMNLMALNWDILMVTCVAGPPLSDQKHTDSTWVTTSPFFEEAFVLLFIQTFLMYGWTSPFIVVDEEANAVYSAVARDFYSIAPKFGVHPVRGYSTSKLSNSSSFHEILDDFHSSSRVMMFLGHAQPFRQMLIESALQDMTDGNHVFIALEVFPHKIFGNFTWKYDDDQDKIAKEAFRSAILLGLPPKKFEDTPNIVMDQLGAKWMNDSFLVYNYSYTEDKRPIEYQLGMYYAVTAFADILNESLTQHAAYHSSIGNGRQLARRFFNRSLVLDGAEVYFDRAGSRQKNLYVHFFDNESENFRPFLRLDKKTHLVSVIAAAKWLGGRPPTNEPPCGFDNLRQICRASGEQALIDAVIGSVSAIIIIVAASAITIRRLRRRNKSLNEPWWIVPAEQLILLPDILPNKEVGRKHSY